MQRILNWLNKGVLLADHLESKDQNNFNFVRLASALLIILGHACGLFDRFSDPVYIYSGKLLYSTGLGMVTFFFLSGLLVSRSLRYSASWKNFSWKRILRLYPAAIASVLLAALVIGPLVTTRSPVSYFSDPLFFQYLRTCFLIKIYYELPGVFEHSIAGRSVNASLWSLSLELKLYAGLLLTALIRNTAWKKALLILLTLSVIVFACFYVYAAEQWLREKTGQTHDLSTYAFNAPYFLMGMLCFLYSDRIFIRNYWIVLIVLVYAVSGYSGLGVFNGCSFFLLPAMILYFSVKGAGLIRRITPRADLSYGIYVLGFPVQQLVLNYAHPSGSFQLFFITLLILVPLAALSWFFIEKPALSLKHLVK